MVKLILCTRCEVKVNREVGDAEDGFVCFACSEKEEMKREVARLRQFVCELVETLRGGVGRVQREVVNCSTQTEAGVVTVCVTSQTEQGVIGGKGVVCESGVSTQTKEGRLWLLEGGGGGGGGSQGHCTVGIGEWEEGVCEGGATG